MADRKGSSKNSQADRASHFFSASRHDLGDSVRNCLLAHRRGSARNSTIRSLRSIRLQDFLAILPRQADEDSGGGDG